MKSRLIAVLACVAGLAPGLASGPARAAGGAGAETPVAPASRLELAMTLYAGGITMGTMDIDATIRGADYHAVADLRTSGVINAFWQAQIQATASGKVASRAFAPTLYDSFDTGHAGKKQEVSLTFDGANPPRLFADPVYSTTGFEVKPDDIKNTLDPLSAVAFILSGIRRAGRQPLRPDDAGLRWPPPLQYRDAQGPRHGHPHGQWLLPGQGRGVRSALPPDRGLSAAGAESQ